MSHPHSSEIDPPCRSCTSFKEYLKQSKKRYADETTKVKDVENLDIDLNNCPLDKDLLGRYTWGFLHTMAANYPKAPSPTQQNDMKTFFTLFAKFYPCDWCAADLRKDLIKSPPKTESQDALSKWLCFQHNQVNKKLGKPEFDCSKVNERWRDGWKDGSCG